MTINIHKPTESAQSGAPELNVETLRDLTADQWALDVRGGAARSLCTNEMSGCN